jgi:hypothetical protein
MHGKSPSLKLLIAALNSPQVADANIFSTSSPLKKAQGSWMLASKSPEKPQLAAPAKPTFSTGC